MNKLKIIAGILGLLSLPISLYLTYWMLLQLPSDRLIWFLFWMNVPIIFIIQIIVKFVEDD